MTVALVVGSLHMDLIATAATLPTPGASVTGDAFQRSPGGKAGNQAVQLARLGIPTALAARVGADPFGDELVQAMTSAGVESSLVSRDPDLATGASTVIAAEGDYLSVIVPGASSAMGRHDLDAVPPSVEVVLAQLELPIEVAIMISGWAVERDLPLVLNASPLPSMLDDAIAAAIGGADTVVVNRAEAALLAGRDVESAADANLAAEAIADRHGVGTVVVTLGATGAICRHPAGIDYHPGWPVKVVDTVGSGDAFLATFVASRIEGRSVPLAMERATAAGALGCTRAGALPGMPTAAELDAFISRGPVYRNINRGSLPTRV